MHPFTKVQQAMLEEEKWTTPSMTYFRPHFMMPPAATAAAAATRYDPPMTNTWLNNYDQALDLGQTQQTQQKPQAHKTIKHEHVDQTRYGFDQVNYSGNQPKSVKKNEEGKKYACDQCSYVATQRSSLSRHKQTQHENIKAQPVRSGKTYDCELCPYQAPQLASLKRHTMAKHSGAQHPCNKCEYVGSTPYNLKLHASSKHEGIRYPCDVCGYQATRTGDLNRHKEMKHGFQRGSQRERAPQQQQQQRGQQQQRQQQQQRRPAGPKQPLSGFYHFSTVGRAKVKAAHPEYNDTEVSEEISRRWHALDGMTKAMFEEVADNGGNNYGNRRGGGGGGGGGNQRQQMVSYGRGNYGKRAKKDPNAPKRSLSAFMFFSNAEQANVRRDNPTTCFRIGDTAKELGRRWGEASTEVRQKYVEMSNKDKMRYEREKHEYHLNKPADQMSPQGPSYTNGHTYQPQPPRHVEITNPSRMIGPPNLGI